MGTERHSLKQTGKEMQTRERNQDVNQRCKLERDVAQRVEKYVNPTGMLFRQPCSYVVAEQVKVALKRLHNKHKLGNHRNTETARKRPKTRVDAAWV